MIIIIDGGGGRRIHSFVHPSICEKKNNQNRAKQTNSSSMIVNVNYRPSLVFLFFFLHRFVYAGLWSILCVYVIITDIHHLDIKENIGSQNRRIERKKNYLTRCQCQITKNENDKMVCGLTSRIFE